MYSLHMTFATPDREHFTSQHIEAWRLPTLEDAQGALENAIAPEGYELYDYEIVYMGDD